MNTHLSPADSARLQEIASLTGCSLDHVEAVHEHEWQELEAQARIRDYLPLLTMKHVWARCLEERAMTEASLP